MYTDIQKRNSTMKNFIACNKFKSEKFRWAGDGSQVAGEHLVGQAVQKQWGAGNLSPVACPPLHLPPLCLHPHCSLWPVLPSCSLQTLPLHPFPSYHCCYMARLVLCSVTQAGVGTEPASTGEMVKSGGRDTEGAKAEEMRGREAGAWGCSRERLGVQRQWGEDSSCGSGPEPGLGLVPEPQQLLATTPPTSPISYSVPR